MTVKHLTLLLGCLSSTCAFAPSFNSKSKAFVFNYMPHQGNTISSTLFETALSADVEESNGADDSIIEKAEEKNNSVEDDISCVAYVVNLSYGEKTNSFLVLPRSGTHYHSLQSLTFVLFLSRKYCRHIFSKNSRNIF